MAIIGANPNPTWNRREYNKFAEEAFGRNVIAHRAINMLTQSAASVPWLLHDNSTNSKIRIEKHHLIDLLRTPNPSQSGITLFENMYAYKLISGNSYLMAIRADQGHPPLELHVLRPDRVTIMAGHSYLPSSYRYDIGGYHKYFPVDPVTGRSDILHVKHFHPLNDWYGLSPVEAAAYSIDQHNQAAIWNQALLQNGARPSGALVVQSDGTLSEEQFTRLKNQLEECYSGSTNAGRPLLLEGGLDWREMGMSNKEMDFIEMKNSSARDIALAFGVPHN
jgi:HK97 family phage portal protein